MHKDLCIITARGGSKRIPHKNIRDFYGLPMVAWPTRAAVSSGLFQKIIISTEDDDIATVAKQYGAEQPFSRPAELANDFATTTDVLRHALNEFEKNEELPCYCCCLYGTSAMITASILNKARELLTSTQCVFAVTEYSHPIERALSITGDGSLTYLYPDNIAKRTQDCTKSYHDIGLFYYFESKAFLAAGKTPFSSLNKKGIIIPHTQAIDIDTEEDWKFAELVASHNKLES